MDKIRKLIAEIGEVMELILAGMVYITLELTTLHGRLSHPSRIYKSVVSGTKSATLNCSSMA